MNSITINIGGKDRDFHFGLGFLGELVDSFEMSVADLGAKTTLNPHKYSPIIMYCSAVYALNRKGEKADFIQYDFIDWIDELGGIGCKEMQDFNNALIASMTKNVPVVEDNKKKVKK